MSGTDDLALLEAVYRDAPVGLAVLDRELRFLRINDRLAEMNGIPAAAHIGHTVRELVPAVADAVEAIARPVLDRGEAVRDVPLSGETPAHPGVVRHWVEQWYPLRNSAGEVIGINVVVEEVTERLRAEAALRASEARLRSIVAQGPAALAVLEGPEQLYTLVSPLYEAWLGRGPLAGRTFLEALPELRGTEAECAHRHVFETGEPRTVHEMPVRLDRDGDGTPEDYVFTVHYTALRDAANAVFAVAALVDDVTEQVQARRDIQAAHADAQMARTAAEMANRAKSDFLAVMSHELRTPLNAIGGYAELLEMGIRGPMSELQRQDLRRIQASQRHLLGLINEVLNYAKVETGSVRYDVVDVPVHEALDSAEPLVAPQARAKGLALEITACPVQPNGSPVVVRADPEKLRQILVNLLSNAVKFTDRGGTVALDCVASPDHVQLVVRDTGIGIANDQLERIFEPFVQVRSDLTRTAEGAGLGLAISRDLARGMRGDLTVESTIGRGSAFTLTLPRG